MTDYNLNTKQRRRRRKKSKKIMGLDTVLLEVIGSHLQDVLLPQLPLLPRVCDLVLVSGRLGCWKEHLLYLSKPIAGRNEKNMKK
jgi:hypothetical protein